MTEGLKIIPMHRSDRYSTVDAQASQRKLTGRAAGRKDKVLIRENSLVFCEVCGVLRPPVLGSAEKA